jgi:phosphate-selective porin OprO/OprP
LEEQTSSNNIDFMERSYVNALAPAKKIGAMFFGEPVNGMTYAVSAYQMNDTEQDSKNDKMSYAGRTTINFGELFENKTMVAHVGLAGFDAEYNVTPTSSSGVKDASPQTTNATTYSRPRLVEFEMLYPVKV